MKGGFENVRWTEDAGELIYTVENNTYKIQSQGIAKALQTIQSNLTGDKACTVIVTHYNVPQLALRYAPGESFVDSVGVQLNDWKASYELGDSWKKVKGEKKTNSSLFKVDINVYPQLSYKNLIINQIYQWMFTLSPEVSVSLLPGMKLAGMLKLPVYNDGYSDREGKVHPGQITLSQRFRLPYNIKGRVAVGYFNAERYGIDATLFFPFKDERFSVEGRYGYLGMAYWDAFKLHYGTAMYASWTLKGNFFWKRYNSQFSLSVNRWIRLDEGLKFEMIRHFRYASIGLYLNKSFRKGAPTNGGFRFQVALPPYKVKRYKHWPRVNTSANMGLIYNAGNEQYYYGEYKAEASDNIMEANSFNPLFIQNEIIK